MKDYILVFDEKHIEFDNIEALKNYLIPDYEKMDETELQKYMYENVFGFCMMNHLQIINTKKGVYGSNFTIEETVLTYEDAIIIDDIDTYILSLCKYNIIFLLEEKDNRFYTKNAEIDFKEDNYVLVNAFSKKLLNDKIEGETI